MSGRRVVAVAHFPPPVHGMAVAVERLVSELETVCAVRRVNIGAPGLERSAPYHAVRVGRVLRALTVLAAERRRSSRAFFSCDAGVGMLYTLLLTITARLIGYRMYLQHHSYAYIERRSTLLALAVRMAGDRCVHLAICAQMQADFLAAYPRATTQVVGVAAGLEPAERTVRERGPHLVLGFLGNVSVDKGIDLALALTRTAAGSGIPVQLRVAGPVVDPHATALLDDAAADPGIDMVRVGPVYGEDRDRFLDDLDVFLFPSRYPHESFGLVAWEAMARGVPVLAHRSGCTTADALGGAGLVVERAHDFVGPTRAVLERWRDDPEALRAAGVQARERARSTRAAAERETARLCAELGGRAPRASSPATGDRGRR